MRRCILDVGQRWLHSFFPCVLGERGVGQVGLVGEAMVDVLVVGDIQGTFAADVGLAAVNGKPISPVDGEGPASECD